MAPRSTRCGSRIARVQKLLDLMDNGALKASDTSVPLSFDSVEPEMAYGDDHFTGDDQDFLEEDGFDDDDDFDEAVGEQGRTEMAESDSAEQGIVLGISE